MSDFLCKMWYWYMLTILQVSVCMIEIILAIRGKLKKLHNSILLTLLSISFRAI